MSQGSLKDPLSRGAIRLELVAPPHDAELTSELGRRRRPKQKHKDEPKHPATDYEADEDPIPPWWTKGNLIIESGLLAKDVDLIVRTLVARRGSSIPGPDKLVFTGASVIDLRAMTRLNGQLKAHDLDLPIELHPDPDDE